MHRIYKKFVTSLKMQLKRRYLMLLKKEAVEDGLRRRRGECHGCGECCKASFPCPFLFELNGQWLCQIHETKPEVCKTYPFNEQDMFPHAKGKCGYFFVTGEHQD
ncbi:MAG: YkgJ family cysteine cluster protein [Candidatus Ozemobacteraceae bacterium]